jgi:hypothetical protein
MTTRIADDYTAINRAMAQRERDRRVLRFQPPDGVTIVLQPPVSWNPKNGLCYLLQVDTGRLSMVLRRDSEPDMRTMDRFYNHLQHYFPSVRLRTPIEIVLSPDDALLLANRLSQ